MNKMKQVAIRSMLIAPPDCLLISIDLSQAESWVVAFLAFDENMQYHLKYGDIHTYAAIGIYGGTKDTITKSQRYIGKRSNHMLAYGATYIRLAQAINADSDKPPFITVSLSESLKIFDAWHNTFPTIKRWHKEIGQIVNETRTIHNLYGRPRMFLGTLNESTLKEAYAHQPQSSIADHTNGMIHPELNIPGGALAVYKQIVVPSNKEIRFLNQSHDSILLSCPKTIVNEIALMAHGLMQRPLIAGGQEFVIPAEVEIGERYGELEKLSTKHPYKDEKGEKEEKV